MRNFILQKRFVLLSSALVVILLSHLWCLFRFLPIAGSQSRLSVLLRLMLRQAKKLTQQIELTLGQQSQAMDIAIDVVGFGRTLDGIAQMIEPAQYTDSDSAAVLSRSIKIHSDESRASHRILLLRYRFPLTWVMAEDMLEFISINYQILLRRCTEPLMI